MKKLLLIPVLSLLCSCAASTADTLQQAEGAIAADNLAEARKCCEALVADSVAAPLTPSQLCRVALIYAKLSERTDNPDDMATAASCFSHALELNTDSVLAFIRTLDFPDFPYIKTIEEVQSSLLAPSEFSDFPQ